MSKIQTLRGLINQRLSLAAEEIFELFERTIAEYEEQLSRSKENQHKLLEAVFNPEVRLHRADVQTLLVKTENVPSEQQEGGPSLDQEDPPEPAHIKEEEEEVWRRQETEQLHGLEEEEEEEEEESSEFTLTPVAAKNEEEEEEAQSSQFDEKQGQLSDVQVLLVKIENIPAEQQERGPSLDQEDPPEPAHIKEDEEEVWRCQETEQLHGLKEEEEESSEFTVTPVPTKNEEEGEEAESSQLDEKQTEEMLDCKSETDVSTDYLEESAKPQSALNHVSHMESYSVETAVSVSERATSSGPKEPEPDATKIQKEEKPFSCSLCGKTFLRKPYLKQHMICHSGEKRFCCSLCNRRFTTNGSLKQHSLLHEENRPHGCSVCGKRFKQEFHLFKHQKTHKGDHEGLSEQNLLHQKEAANSDVTCESKKNQKSSSDSETKSEQKKRKKQKDKEIPKKEKPLCCFVCGKTFIRKLILRRHMRRHKGGKTYSCAVCDKSFTVMEHLKIHMICHSSEKRYSCSICGKAFNRTGYLKQHMMCHSGEKPFSCSVCDRRFRQKSNLIQHMRCHTGERPHSCSVCSKRFRTKCGLTRHTLIHSNELYIYENKS